jgi:hypothetical protein
MCDLASDDESHRLVCYESSKNESAHALETRPNLAERDGTVETYNSSNKQMHFNPTNILLYKRFLILLTKQTCEQREKYR